MPRRSKSNKDGAVFTYYERQRMDHGSKHKRLPGAALKAWDLCALGLTATDDPVLTPAGVLYDREAILRELLRQREAARADRDRVEKEREREENDELRERRQRKLNIAAEFEKRQGEVLPGSASRTGEARDEEGREEERFDSSFWMPNAEVKRITASGQGGKKEKGKVSLKTRCPISKKPLRTKDLISLKLTKNKTGDMAGVDNGTGKYMCPVCQTALGNAVKPVALRTGTVLCSKCVAKFVMKEAVDPCTSDIVDVEKDVIPIFNVGTAFAGSAADDPASREASLYRPSAR